MNTSLKVFVSFLAFLIIFIIVIVIVDGASFNMSMFSNARDSVNALMLIGLPPLAAAFTFNKKPKVALWSGVVLSIVFAFISSMLTKSSEDLSFLMVPFTVMWILGAMFVAAILRYIVDRCAQRSHNITS